MCNLGHVARHNQFSLFIQMLSIGIGTRDIKTKSYTRFM